VRAISYIIKHISNGLKCVLIFIFCTNFSVNELNEVHSKKIVFCIILRITGFSDFVHRPLF
jgi:hypothetical protein